MADEQERRERAYYLWENNGRPEGRHMEHWSEAGDGESGSSSTTQSPADPAQNDATTASEDPAEGSEATIERELDRQDADPAAKTAAK